MPRRSATFVLFAFLALVDRDESCIHAQELAANPTSETKPTLGLASLKISLRLQDGAPFLGAVTVRLMPGEGYEKVGAHDEIPGDFLFPEVEPAKYEVE
jgi:hypothetical protein